MHNLGEATGSHWALRKHGAPMGTSPSSTYFTKTMFLSALCCEPLPSNPSNCFCTRSSGRSRIHAGFRWKNAISCHGWPMACANSWWVFVKWHQKNWGMRGATRQALICIITADQCPGWCSPVEAGLFAQGWWLAIGVRTLGDQGINLGTSVTRFRCRWPWKSRWRYKKS